MKRLPEVIDEERGRLRAEKLERVTLETEAYWNEIEPCGALPVNPFTLGDGVELLLYDLRRYQAAVAGIFEKEQDQKALLDHKTATGQEVDAGRQFLTVIVAFMVRLALLWLRADFVTGRRSLSRLSQTMGDYRLSRLPANLATFELVSVLISQRDLVAGRH